MIVPEINENLDFYIKKDKEDLNQKNFCGSQENIYFITINSVNYHSRL